MCSASTYLDVVLIQNGRISGDGETVIHGHHRVRKHKGHEKPGVKQHRHKIWGKVARACVVSAHWWVGVQEHLRAERRTHN